MCPVGGGVGGGVNVVGGGGGGFGAVIGTVVIAAQGWLVWGPRGKDWGAAIVGVVWRHDGTRDGGCDGVLIIGK